MIEQNPSLSLEITDALPLGTYKTFLQTKRIMAHTAGIEVPLMDIRPKKTFPVWAGLSSSGYCVKDELRFFQIAAWAKVLCSSNRPISCIAIPPEMFSF